MRNRVIPSPEPTSGSRSGASRSPRGCAESREIFRPEGSLPEPIRALVGVSARLRLALRDDGGVHSRALFRLERLHLLRAHLQRSTDPLGPRRIRRVLARDGGGLASRSARCVACISVTPRISSRDMPFQWSTRTRRPGASADTASAGSSASVGSAAARSSSAAVVDRAPPPPPPPPRDAPPRGARSPQPPNVRNLRARFFAPPRVGADTPSARRSTRRARDPPRRRVGARSPSRRLARRTKPPPAPTAPYDGRPRRGPRPRTFEDCSRRCGGRRRPRARGGTRGGTRGRRGRIRGDASSPGKSTGGGGRTVGDERGGVNGRGMVGGRRTRGGGRSVGMEAPPRRGRARRRVLHRDRGWWVYRCV